MLTHSGPILDVAARKPLAPLVSSPPAGASLPAIPSTPRKATRVVGCLRRASNELRARVSGSRGRKSVPTTSCGDPPPGQTGCECNYSVTYREESPEDRSRELRTRVIGHKIAPIMLDTFDGHRCHGEEAAESPPNCNQLGSSCCRFPPNPPLSPLLNKP